MDFVLDLSGQGRAAAAAGEEGGWEGSRDEEGSAPLLEEADAPLDLTVDKSAIATDSCAPSSNQRSMPSPPPPLPDDSFSLLTAGLLSNPLFHSLVRQHTLLDKHPASPGLEPATSQPETAVESAVLSPYSFLSTSNSPEGSEQFKLEDCTNDAKPQNNIKLIAPGEHCEICVVVSSKEHFHCFDSACLSSSGRPMRSEEAVRHANWHKKQRASLERGFQRFALNDDCSGLTATCRFRLKSTHYHCLVEGCGTIVGNTTDMNFHAAHHAKGQEMLNEGFTRFSASTDCHTDTCPFRLDRTTHFHCCKPGCHVTFKEKSGMEKHKAFHAKNEEYLKQGFYKCLKGFPCGHANCHLTNINHFHCSTRGCVYSFTSTNQISPHRNKYHWDEPHLNRKRKEHEQQQQQSPREEEPDLVPRKVPKSDVALLSQSPLSGDSSDHVTGGDYVTSLLNSANLYNQSAAIGRAMAEPAEALRRRLDHGFQRWDAADVCGAARCPFLLVQHWHCTGTCCNKVESHASLLSFHQQEHSLLTRKIESLAERCGNYMCRHYMCSRPHWHCRIGDCEAVVRSEYELTLHYIKHLPNIIRQAKFCCNCEFQGVEHFHCTHEGCDKIFDSLLETDQHVSGHGVQLTNEKREPAPKSSQSAVPSIDQSEAAVSSAQSENTCIHQSVITPTGLARGHLSAEGSLGQSEPLALVQSDSQSEKRSAESQSEKRIADNQSDKRSADNQSEKRDREMAVQKLMTKSDTHGLTPDMFVCVRMQDRCHFPECTITGRRHYHCTHPGCSFITSNLRVFPTHHQRHRDSERKCHPGYSHFPKKVDCAFPACLYRRLTAHFHCMRAGCGFAFSFANQMAPHTRKHDKFGPGYQPPHPSLSQASHSLSQAGGHSLSQPGQTLSQAGDSSDDLGIYGL